MNTNMKWFTYRQNNSGGSFHECTGIGVCVIVEARDAEHADQRATEIGVYFDGVDDGLDCPCCGDRWYRKYPYETGDDCPSIYGTPLDECNSSLFMKSAWVHPIEGECYEVKLKS